MLISLRKVWIIFHCFLSVNILSDSPKQKIKIKSLSEILQVMYVL